MECGDGFISTRPTSEQNGPFFWAGKAASGGGTARKTIAPAFANSPSDWVTNAQKASTRLTGSFATRLRRNIEETTKHTGGGSLEPREFVMKRPFDGFLKNLSLRKHQRLFAVSPRSSDMPMAATFTENSLTSAMPSRGGSKRKGRGGGTKFDWRWRLPALAARLRRCTRKRPLGFSERLLFKSRTLVRQL